MDDVSSRRTSGEIYAGLTAQALYVLIRAENTYPILSTNPRLKAAKRDFLALALNGFNGLPPLVSRGASDNERVHDSDRYLPGVPYTVEQAAFLWYPWTLLTASALRPDEQLTDMDRNRAIIIVDALIQRLPDFIEFAHNDPSLYPTAEGLLSIALHWKMMKSGNE